MGNRYIITLVDFFSKWHQGAKDGQAVAWALQGGGAQRKGRIQG